MLINEKYVMELPFDFPDYDGNTYADLLLQVIHRMVLVGPRILKPMYKSLVSIISNVAPYIKEGSTQSCDCILHCLKILSQRHHVMESEENCRVVNNLMEAINYILQYNDSTNRVFRL